MIEQNQIVPSETKSEAIPETMEMAVSKPYLSIVIPLYNEEGNVEPLYKELTQALEQIGHTYEVIAINDGSRDRTYEKLQEVFEHDARWRVIGFRRNFGQTAAMTAGFDAARGDVVVTIDADLQNNPLDIPKLLEKLDEGYDIVSGWRQNRKENYNSGPWAKSEIPVIGFVRIL